MLGVRVTSAQAKKAREEVEKRSWQLGDPTMVEGFIALPGGVSLSPAPIGNRITDPDVMLGPCKPI
jgi:hypothetical protein